MNKFSVYGLGLIAALGIAVSMPAIPIPVFAQYNVGGGAQVATPEQVEECKRIGIPEFTCTEQNILAKKRLLNAQANPSTGSGTPMLSTGFGDMGAFIAALGAIFGGVAAAFFAMSRKKTPVTQ
jgi:hypothetical protein